MDRYKKKTMVLTNYLKNMAAVWLLILVSSNSVAQTITPQVINSAGDHRQAGNSGVWITDNVGEPFTQTMGAGNLFITQGFIQPDIVSPGGFTVSSIFQSPACQERSDDAFISVLLTSTVKNYSTKYFWTPSGVCPGNNCNEVKGVKPGNYNVKVVVNYSNSIGVAFTDTVKTQDFIIQQATAPCKIFIYNAVSPNNDGINDTWIIDNISDYPNNRVTIYNRWGNMVAEYQGYGIGNKIWPIKAQLDFLPASTYFYVIELEPGANPIKGWVELMKTQ